MTRSIVLVVVSLFGMFAVPTAVTLAGVPSTATISRAVGPIVLLLVLGSLVYAAWTAVSIRICFCPQCGKRTVKADGSYPEINRYCPLCNVEWITGMRVNEESFD